MRNFRIFVLALACVVALSAGGMASAQVDIPDDPIDDPLDDPTKETHSGVTTPVGPDTEQSILDTAEAADTSYLPIGELPDSVVRLDTGSERPYVLVHSDTGVSQGTITGYEIRGIEESIIVATDVQTSSNPSSADAGAVFSDPANYRGELVRIQVQNYSQVPLAAHTAQGAVSDQYAVGTNAEASLPVDPATLGLDAVGDTVGSDVDATDPETFYDGGQAVLDAGDQQVTASVRREAYAGQGAATVEIGVVGGQPQFYVTDVDWDAESIGAIGAVGDASEGDVVTVEAARAEATLSTRATIQQVANCGSDLIAIPGVGCVPATADVVGHAGVLYEGNTTVPFVGASNKIQTTPVETAGGVVTVTARVVNASAVPGDVAADRALVVQDVEPVGSGSASEAAIEQRDALLDGVRTSLYRQLRGVSKVELPANGSRPVLDDVEAVPDEVNVSESVTVNATVENAGWAAYDRSLRLTNGSETLATVGVNASVEAQTTAVLTVAFEEPGNVSLSLTGDGLPTADLGTIAVVNASAENGSDGSPDNESDGENEGESSESDDNSGGGGGFFIPSGGGGDDPPEETGGDENETDSEDGTDESESDDTSETDETNAGETDPANESSSSEDDTGGTGSAADDGTPGFGVVSALLALLAGVGARVRE